MDPNAVVLQISSDEEGCWNGPNDKGVIDSGDGYDWIADILDEVNRENCDHDDSDEVVLVSEVLPRKPRKKLTPKPSSLIDFDDDCVVLDHDPDKPPDTRIDKRIDRDEDDDSDDILVVGEKGQVACRDYAHPRHLCIKFPFSSTPNQSHCDQCYCYVCDSLAPCIYWGNGSGIIDHCLATDKDDFWKLERQNLKNVGKVVNVPSMNPVPQTPPVAHKPNPIQACTVASGFGVPNIISVARSPSLLSSSQFPPSLVSQQLTRTSSCTVPRGKVHHSYNLASSFHRPVLKRNGFAPTTNQHSYSPYYRGNYRNQFTGSSHSVPYSPSSNSPVDFPPNFQRLVNSDPYAEVPSVFPPYPVPLSSQAQGKSSLPDYTIPPEASRQDSQMSTVDPKFFHGISWPQSQINHEPAAQSSVVGSTTGCSVASGTGGLVDYEYDNWMFNNPPCEAGAVDGSGPFGLREFSPDPGFVDSGPIFDF